MGGPGWERLRGQLPRVQPRRVRLPPGAGDWVPDSTVGRPGGKIFVGDKIVGYTNDKVLDRFQSQRQKLGVLGAISNGLPVPGLAAQLLPVFEANHPPLCREGEGGAGSRQPVHFF